LTMSNIYSLTMRKLFLFIIIHLVVFQIRSQEIIHPSLVKWYTLEQAIKLAETNPRPIMLDVYTDWCSWCKFMMTTTFANKALAEYINNNFYAAKFNAETFDTVQFKGQKYINRRVGSKPSHDLASILLEGRLSYPSLVFFDRDGNRSVIPGYKEPKDIEPFLIYFVENVNKTASLDDFYINYMFSFPSAFKADHSIFKIDSKLKPDTLGKLNTISINDLPKLQKKNPKPFILFLYTDWSVSSKVMERTTLRNSVLNAKINNTHHFIKFNAASNDTISFLGKNYVGTGQNQPHQLSHALLNNNFQMPALIFFDEKGTIQGMINGFWSTGQMLPLFDFFYSGANNKMSFQEYIRSNQNPQ